MIVTALLKKLDEAQLDLARGAMLAPKADLFEHGKTVGMYLGLERARELLGDVIGEDEEKDKRL